MLKKHNGGIYCNGFLSNHQMTSRESCASTKAYTGKIMGVWDDETTHLICEINDTNDQKVMIFVATVHGMVSIAYASCQ